MSVVFYVITKRILWLQLTLLLLVYDCWGLSLACYMTVGLYHTAHKLHVLAGISQHIHSSNSEYFFYIFSPLHMDFIHGIKST